jgi:hypothetical protein
MELTPLPLCYHTWNIKQIWCDSKLKIVRVTVECGYCLGREVIETKYPKKQHILDEPKLMV